MIKKLDRYNVQIKIEGFAEAGDMCINVPMFSRKKLCSGIDNLMIFLESCKEHFFLLNKKTEEQMENYHNRYKIHDIIEYDEYYIEIREDGIYRITQKRGCSKIIFHGKFEFIGYEKRKYPSEDIYIIMRDGVPFSGTFKELMNELSSYIYSSSYDFFKGIFHHYKDKFEDDNNGDIVY